MKITPQLQRLSAPQRWSPSWVFSVGFLAGCLVVGFFAMQLQLVQSPKTVIPSWCVNNMASDFLQVFEGERNMSSDTNEMARNETELTFGVNSTTEQLNPTTNNYTEAGVSTSRATEPESLLSILQKHPQIDSAAASELVRGVEEITYRREAREVRILCWIMTMPANHMTKARHVRDTWGRHCNVLLFVSEQTDASLPAVALGRSGREGLWSKTVAAFKYVNEKYALDFDWVIKADDDTYVVVENLRKMLYPYKPTDPHYFGFHYKPVLPQGFNSGGAGYVLSREGVSRLVGRALEGRHADCPVNSSSEAEDINLARCLRAVGIEPEDSRDWRGRNRFLPYSIQEHTNPNISAKHWVLSDYNKWPMQGGTSCCSDEVVSFHYISPGQMYMLEFLVYHVRVFPVMHLAPATHPPRTP